MPDIEMRVNLKGLQKLASVLPQVEDQICDLASEAIQDEAKRTVPVDTGFLKSTIGRVQKGAGHWLVFALANYASYVEFGTRKMAAQPFMRPAFERVNLSKIVQQVFKRIGL